MNASFPCTLLDELHRIPSAAEGNRSHEILSKADFLHAVEMLAGKLTRPGLGEFDGDDMEAIFVACPYNTWKEIFGELPGFRECRGVVSHPPVEVWEQPCSDGVVHCVGYCVDDPHDGQSVILTRVCLF